jgi:pre-mRNA-processing factor 6
MRAERPKIQQQFADLKRGLSAVTDTEWENLPEVGNLTKRRKVRETRTYAVPDSILVGDRDKNALESSLDTRQQEVSVERVAFMLPLANTVNSTAALKPQQILVH